LNNSPRAYIEGSELFHYYNARVDAGTFPRDEGMTIRQACKTLADYGMAVEYSWPYDTSKFNEKPSQIAYVFAPLYKVKEYYRVYDIQALKECLMNNFPIVCGIWVYENFYGLNNKNYNYVPTGANKGGHAVDIIGYDDERQVFILRNSWGTTFGKEGYFEMSYEVFQKYSFDWWTVKI
jgi:C1A family cysteine protease